MFCPSSFFCFILVLAKREHLRYCFLVCPEVRVELGKWRAVKQSVGEMQLRPVKVIAGRRLLQERVTGDKPKQDKE